FTARLLRILAIFDAQGQSIHARLEIRSDIKLERNVAATIVAHLLAVDPNRARIIDGAEVQEQIAFVKLFRELKRTRVPNHFMNRLVADPGKFGLITERDVDAQRQRASVLPTETQAF